MSASCRAHRLVLYGCSLPLDELLFIVNMDGTCVCAAVGEQERVTINFLDVLPKVYWQRLIINDPVVREVYARFWKTLRRDLAQRDAEIKMG